MIELQTTWSWLIVIYLFLGGLAGGAFSVVSVLRLVGKGRFKTTIAFGAWAATISLAAGLLALLLDVEKPFSALMMWQSFSNLSSWMAIGAWLIFVAFIVFLVASLFLTDKTAAALGKLGKPFREGRDTITKALSFVGIILGICVAVYTGILLGAAPSIPLWNSWLLPVLFTVSALDTGIAAVLIFYILFEKDDKKHQLELNLERAVIGLVIVEAIVLAVFLGIFLQGTQSEVIAASLIVNGGLSPVFWGLLVVVGLAVPLVVAVIRQFVKGRHHKVVPIGGAVCTLIGGLCLRYVIVSAGIHGVLVSPVAEQAMRGVYQLIS